MAQGPVALGVQGLVEVGAALVQDLSGGEAVEPQQPIRLVEAVLPQQGRLEPRGHGQALVVGDGHIGGEKPPLQPVFPVKPLRQRQNVPIALRGGPHDHLGGLPRRGKFRRVAVELQLRLGLGGPVPDLGHGGENGGPALVRGQQAQGGLGGQLDVDAQAVRQQAQLVGQPRIRPGDGLGVDVAVEAVLGA